MTSFHPAFVFCQELMDAKTHDYGRGQPQDPARIEYHPYGDISYLQMLHTKLKRIESMVMLEKDGKTPNFESKRDSIVDLINYAAFYYAWVETAKK